MARNRNRMHRMVCCGVGRMYRIVYSGISLVRSHAVVVDDQDDILRVEGSI